MRSAAVSNKSNTTSNSRYEIKTRTIKLEDHIIPETTIPHGSCITPSNTRYDEIKANNLRVSTARKGFAITLRNVIATDDAIKAAETVLQQLRQNAQVARKQHDEANAELADAEKCQQITQKMLKASNFVRDYDKKCIGNSTTKRVCLTIAPDKVLVEGCRSREVNGVYERVTSFTNHTRYHKTVYDGHFSLGFNYDHWYIRKYYDESMCYDVFYVNPRDDRLPPKDGWKAGRCGKTGASPHICY